jgi:hypothetical protein
VSAFWRVVQARQRELAGAALEKISRTSLISSNRRLIGVRFDSEIASEDAEVEIRGVCVDDKT